MEKYCVECDLFHKCEVDECERCGEKLIELGYEEK